MKAVGLAEALDGLELHFRHPRHSVFIRRTVRDFFLVSLATVGPSWASVAFPQALSIETAIVVGTVSAATYVLLALGAADVMLKVAQQGLVIRPGTSAVDAWFTGGRTVVPWTGLSALRARARRDDDATWVELTWDCVDGSTGRVRMPGHLLHEATTFAERASERIVGASAEAGEVPAAIDQLRGRRPSSQ